MKPLKIAAILPARMASSRFPGKPLLKIRGVAMIEHVRRRTLLATGFSDVVVATCDLEIAQVVEQAGGKVVMTSPASGHSQLPRSRKGSRGPRFQSLPM